MTQNTTKAQRIFSVTYVQCKRQMETWGKQYNPNGRPFGFNGVICRDDESVSIRTLNDMQKLIDSRKKMLEMDKKYDIFTAEELADREYIIEAVQVTLDNNRKSLEDFAAELKSL